MYKISKSVSQLVSQSVSQSVSQPVSSSVCPSVSQSVSQSVCLSSQSVSPSVCPFIHQSVSVSVSLSVWDLANMFTSLLPPNPSQAMDSSGREQWYSKSQRNDCTWEYVIRTIIIIFQMKHHMI